MKKIFVLILIVAFIGKPIYNLCYMVYYQINIDYITETFCENKEKVELACNGKCHLAKQLQTESNNQNDDKTIQILSESFVVVFYQNEANFIFSQPRFHLEKKVNSMYNQSYTYVFTYHHFRPPMVSLIS